MSKGFLNKLESLQGHEVIVDDIVVQSELTASSDVAEYNAVQHSEGLYDEVFNVTKNGNGFADLSATLVFGKALGGLPFISIRPEGWVEEDEDTHLLPWSYWFAGREFVVEGELTYYLEEEFWDKGNYISLAGKGLVNSGLFPDFKNTALCAYAHWDSVGEEFIIEGEERHGSSRDTDWHYSKHREDGMQIRQLGQLSWIANDPVNVGLQLTTTQVADEDLEHLITNSNDGVERFTQQLEGDIDTVVMPTLVYDGTAIRRHKNRLPWRNAPLSYNPAGTIVEVPDGKFVNYFLVATHCQATPIKLIMGRKLFDTAGETNTETLEALGLNFPEIAMLYRITLEKRDSYDTVGNCSIYSAQQAASKNIFESQAGIVGSDLKDHSALLGRGVANQHPIEAITNLEIRLTQAAPAGLISMWSGATAPSGWALCDGGNGTPDLRGRFVMGDTIGYARGSSGGAINKVSTSTGEHSHTVTVNNHTLTDSQMPSHRHSITGIGDGNNLSSLKYGVGVQDVTRYTQNTGGSGAHNHGASSGSAGGHTHSTNVLPPYYVLAYIMKL